MYVRAASERSFSGKPLHLLFVDAQNRAIPVNGMFHARLEPLRAFISSYPMDGILRAYEKCGGPINGILSDTTSAFTDQPRLCYGKHRSLQHHPCFRAMMNLQPRIRRLRCSSSCFVTPTADSKRNALLSVVFWPFSELLRSPFHKTLHFLLDFDLREIFFCRPPSHVLFFGRLQFRPILDNFNTVWPLRDLYGNLHTFSLPVYFC